MTAPQSLTGSKYAVLRIRNCYNVYFSNGQKRFVENVHYYGPGPGICGGPSWSSASKTNLVTFGGSAGVANAGVSWGGVAYYGFQQTVVAPLNALLSAGALSAGIFAKWIDVTTDYDQQVGNYAPTLPQTSTSTGNGFSTGGGVGTLAQRLPLDNHVTMRKFTGVAGKEWSRGRWKFAPISETQVNGDELTAAGQTAWAAFKGLTLGGLYSTGPYAPITDGTLTGGPGTLPNFIYPILVSTKLSQLRIEPTRIAYAPLVLPGNNYITGQTAPCINATLGEQKRRKERPDVVF